ncbi:MAG: PDZ domain-containing protein [Candidatus Sulfotelmatobacter sp.]
MSSNGFVGILLLAFLAPAAAQDSLRLYYVDGQALEQITDHDVTVTVNLKAQEKANWLTVYVVNDSNDAVNVIPTSITLHETSPREEDLKLRTERDLQKSAAHSVFWGQVMASIGSLSQSLAAPKTSNAYDPVETATRATDNEAQALWLAKADAVAERGQAITSVLSHEYLRTTTVFPGSRFAGKLCFSRDKALVSGVVRVALGTRSYEFPLPASASTPMPSSAPELPASGAMRSTTAKSDSGLGDSAWRAGFAKSGTLGISGANWMEDRVKGVEILEVAPDSAAETAGLRIGYVITALSGQRIHSTEDLAGILTHSNPGNTILVEYLFPSNLGWLPSHAKVVLADR